MSQHDFDPTKLGGQPLPPQGGLLRDLEGCAARLAQRIYTTPVDATLWRRYADPDHPPDSCLVNLYRGDAKMGMHQDSDEAFLDAPVLGISLGDTAVFRLGGPARKDPTLTVKLHSGDINVLAGASRRAYHGVDRILPGSSQLVPGGGRINLTMRRARG